MVNAARTREVAAMIAAMRIWATARADIEALALVGSWVGGDARMDSDVDFVVLCADPQFYLDDYWWSEELGPLTFVVTREWGPLTEVRFRRPSGLEIEIGFALPSWASPNPIDDGTRDVVSGGLTTLHDPHLLLHRLMRAISSKP